MKKLLLAAMMLFASTAHALGPNVVEIGGQYFNATTKMRVDADGNALTVDGLTPFALIQGSVISTNFVYGADGLSTGWAATADRPKTCTIDSTIAVDTRGYKYVALLLNVAFEDSVYAAQFALQTRLHQNTGIDSLSIYDLLGRFQPTATSGAANNDTLGSLASWGGAELAPASVIYPFGNALADTAKLAPGEQFLILKPTLKSHSNVAVLVASKDGQPLTGLLSWRFRIMNTYNKSLAPYGSATNAYGAGQVTRVVGEQCETSGGDAIANSTQPGRFVSMRVDVVGWN